MKVYKLLYPLNYRLFLLLQAMNLVGAKYAVSESRIGGGVWEHAPSDKFENLGINVLNFN